MDTLVLIGDDILRNPTAAEVDSTLQINNLTDVDSIAVVSVSEDSAYTFPLTNYQSSLAETRIAGDNNQVSEVTRQSDEKILYKLKINEDVLNKRNMASQPTAYAQKLMRESRLTDVNAPGNVLQPAENDDKPKDTQIFQNEFGVDTSNVSITQSKQEDAAHYNVLKEARLYKYKPLKFSADFAGAFFNSASRAVTTTRASPSNVTFAG